MHKADTIVHKNDLNINLILYQPIKTKNNIIYGNTFGNREPGCTS
jgi:hypothetical protein